jgi:hypothetical protein
MGVIVSRLTLSGLKPLKPHAHGRDTENYRAGCPATLAQRPALLVSAPHPSGSIPVSAQGNFMRQRMNGLRKSKARKLALGARDAGADRL